MITRRSIFGLALVPVVPAEALPSQAALDFQRAVRESVENYERARRGADLEKLRQAFVADEEGFRVACQAYKHERIAWLRSNEYTGNATLVADVDFWPNGKEIECQ